MNPHRIVLITAMFCALACSAAEAGKPKEIVVVGSSPRTQAAQFRKVDGLGVDVGHIEGAGRIKKIGSLDTDKLISVQRAARSKMR